MWCAETRVHCALCVHTPAPPPRCRHVQPAGFPFWRYCCCYCCYLFRTITSETPQQTRPSNQWCPHVSPPCSLNCKTASSSSSSSPLLLCLLFNGQIQISPIPPPQIHLFHDWVTASPDPPPLPPTSTGKDGWMVCAHARKHKENIPWQRPLEVCFCDGPSLIDGPRGKSSSLHEWNKILKKYIFSNLLMPTQNGEIFLLLCGDHLYLVPLRIAVHIYIGRAVYPSLIWAFCVFGMYTENPSLPANSMGPSAGTTQKGATMRRRRADENSRFEYLAAVPAEKALSLLNALVLVCRRARVVCKAGNPESALGCCYFYVFRCSRCDSAITGC